MGKQVGKERPAGDLHSQDAPRYGGIAVAAASAQPDITYDGNQVPYLETVTADGAV